MGRKIRMIIAAVLMITAILVTQIPAVDVDAAKVDVGEFTFQGEKLMKYNGKEEVLTIPNATVTIGHDAFSDNQSIKEIVIPDSVKTIDFAAFENCKNLQSVEIGESVKTIGSSAFSGCSSLKNVNLPKKVSEIGSGAFAKCESLSNISVEAGNDNFICTNGVLYSADGTKLIQYLAGTPAVSYSMPSTVDEIEEYAFWGASLLTDLTISAAVKELPEYAFDNCNSLTEVKIPSSVESIYAYAFGNCDNLKTVYLPKSVGYVDKNAFASSRQAHIVSVDDSTAQPSDTVSADTGVSSNSAGLTDAADFTGTIDMQESDVVSGDQISSSSSLIENTSRTYTDYDDQMSDEDLGASKIVGGQVFMLMTSNLPVRGVDVSGMESEDSMADTGNLSMDYSLSENSVSDYSTDGNSFQNSNEIISGVLTNASGSGTVSIPNQVKKVGDRVFYKNPDIETVNFPSSVDSIGDFAFARSAVQSVSLNEGLDQIGYAAFYHCTDLNQIDIPDSVKKIELGAFEGTPWLSNWQASEDKSGGDFLVVGDGILLAYRGNDPLVRIPDGVKSIGPECFQNNMYLNQVEFPNSLIRIGEDAFNGCHMLKEIKLPQNLVTIEDRAFKNCSLSQVEIPSSVASVGLGAFDMTENGYPLQTVVFEGNILPSVTFNSTATRLSGTNLRTPSFHGVNSAIITADTEQLNNTVLDCNQNGFRGMVYKVSKLPEGEAAGQLELQKCMVKPDENDGVARVNTHATINEQPYLMTAVKPEAFKDYETVESWSGLHLTQIEIMGNTSDELSGLLESIPLSQTAGSAYEIDNPVFVYSSDERIEHMEAASATLMDHTDPYMLIVSNDEAAAHQMNIALAKQYSSINGMNIFPMDISMYGAVDMIPITKMNQNKIELTIPIPSQFSNSEQVKVATVDSNGAPELLASDEVNHEGVRCMKFVASHFSAFAFYTLPDTGMAESTTVTNTEGVALGQQAVIAVKQLTKSSGAVKMKWIVALTLAFISILLFCYRKKRVKNK